MKDKLFVSVDFMTALVTNSSTTVFSYADSAGFERFINSLLAHIGSDKKCADLFDVYVFPAVDDLIWAGPEDIEDPDWVELWAKYSYLNGPSEKVVKEFLVAKLRAGKPIDMYFGEHWSGYSNPTEFCIVAKNSGAITELGRLAQCLFSHEAFRDG